MRILDHIVNKTDKTKQAIADEMGWSRQSVYNRLRHPKRMTIIEIEQLAKAVRKSPRNLVALILKNY